MHSYLLSISLLWTIYFTLILSLLTTSLVNKVLDGWIYQHPFVYASLLMSTHSSWNKSWQGGYHVFRMSAVWWIHHPEHPYETCSNNILIKWIQREQPVGWTTAVGHIARVSMILDRYMIHDTRWIRRKRYKVDYCSSCNRLTKYYQICRHAIFAWIILYNIISTRWIRRGKGWLWHVNIRYQMQLHGCTSLDCYSNDLVTCDWSISDWMDDYNSNLARID